MKYRITKVLQIYTPNKTERLIDLGCGFGTFSFALAPFCMEITGVDFSNKSVALCDKLKQERKANNVNFVCAPAQNTGLATASYDAVYCIDLFEHLYPDDSEHVLDECYRLLKKGGKLVIWTPHRGHFLEILKNNNIILKKEVSHVDYKSMKRLLDSLQKRNFSVKKSYYAESHIPVLRALEKLFLPIIPIMRRRIAILAEKN